MLYLVCTPIGNMGDMTYRAVEVLRSVSLILAEDTRHTLPLLEAYDIHKPLRSYQKFNERARSNEVLELLKAGQDVALVTDAGTPLVSDPGAVLLSCVIEEGLPYTLVGSSCAFVSAAVLSGFDLRTFAFCGFLPEKEGARKKYLQGFSGYGGALVFYLSPHGLDGELACLHAAFGARRAVLVREISKKFEECVRFTLGQTPAFTRKGEFVLVLEPQEKQNGKNELSVADHYASYLAEGLDKKEAIKRVAADRGVAKSEIYKAVLELEG